MQYIVYKRFKGKAICGEINLPAFTICECENGLIKYKDKEICSNISEVSHQYFTRNDDKQGLLRGKLTHSIIDTLSKRDYNYQMRWDKIWEDNLCQKYRRSDYSDYWLWGHNFYDAEINDLKYIANLIGAKI